MFSRGTALGYGAGRRGPPVRPFPARGRRTACWYLRRRAGDFAQPTYRCKKDRALYPPGRPAPCVSAVWYIANLSATIRVCTRRGLPLRSDQPCAVARPPVGVPWDCPGRAWSGRASPDVQSGRESLLFLSKRCPCRVPRFLARFSAGLYRDMTPDPFPSDSSVPEASRGKTEPVPLLSPRRHAGPIEGPDRNDPQIRRNPPRVGCILRPRRLSRRPRAPAPIPTCTTGPVYCNPTHPRSEDQRPQHTHGLQGGPHRFRARRV